MIATSFTSIRKQFLSFCRGIVAASCLFSPFKLNTIDMWPSLNQEELPKEMVWIKNVIESAPDLRIDEDGWLVNELTGETLPGINHVLHEDHIMEDAWGAPVKWIVLIQKDTDTIPENEIRYANTTHFLIEGNEVIQTKPPAENGLPQVARWTRYTNLDVRNPCASAMRDVRYFNGCDCNYNPALLDVYYSNSPVATFRRTIVVKVGENLTDTEISNLLGVLTALKRYDLDPWDMVSNTEMYGNVRIGEYDIGPDNMALIRHLLGVKALLSGDPAEKWHVFGDFVSDDGDLQAAVIKYFHVNREYLKKVYMPNMIQKWDALSKYWILMDLLTGSYVPVADSFMLPVENDSGGGYGYLDEVYNLYDPEKRNGYHLGHDFNIGYGNDDEGEPFKCIGNGLVVFSGWTNNGLGQAIIVRHRLPDGSEIYSRYGHLENVYVQEGDFVVKGQIIGTIGRTGHSDCPDFYAHLHLDLPYAATYEKLLKDRPEDYPNKEIKWIPMMFADPIEFISNHQPNKIEENMNIIEASIRQ